MMENEKQLTYSQNSAKMRVDRDLSAERQNGWMQNILVKGRMNTIM